MSIEFMTGDAVLKAADRAVKEGQPLRITDRFEIYEVCVGNNLDGFVLLLFRERLDLLPGKIPEGLMIPVVVGNRMGYFISNLLGSTYID